MTADDAAEPGNRHRDAKPMRVASCREGLACFAAVPEPAIGLMPVVI